MGLLSWLGLKKANSTAKQADAYLDIIKEISANDQRPEFGTKETYIKQAFFNVLKKTDIPEKIQEKLYIEYRSAHWFGNPREAKKAIESYLVSLDWNWPEFDRWLKKFSKNGEWPYMWKKYPELYSPEPFSTDNIQADVKLLRVADMKKIAKLHNAKHLQKREELEEFIINNISSEIIRKEVPERAEAQIHLFYERRKKGRCSLLAHTIAMTIYSKRDAGERRKIANSKYFQEKKLSAHASGCPVEEQFAKKYNDGELKKLPPFFPGDRTSVE